LGGGDDDAAHVLVHLLPTEHVGGHAQVLDATVGAAADDNLVDPHVVEVGGGLGVGGQVGFGNHEGYIGRAPIVDSASASDS